MIESFRYCLVNKTTTRNRVGLGYISHGKLAIKYILLQSIPSKTIHWLKRKPNRILEYKLHKHQKPTWRRNITVRVIINYNGRALGLNHRALGFCFDKSEGNLSRNIAIFFIFTKKILPTLNFHFHDSM